MLAPDDSRCRIVTGVPMGPAHGEREQRKHTEREQSARAVTGMLKAKRELLRDSAPHVVLALVAGAALAPVAAAAAGAGAVGIVPAAILTAAGGVGGNVVSELLMRAVDRCRGEQQGAPGPAAMADAITGDILAALRRDDVLATELARQLIAEVEALGGFEAALGAAGGELRPYLAACFGELREGQRQVLGAVRDVRDEQRRQRADVEEAVDRLRMLSSLTAGERDGGPAARPVAVPVAVPGDRTPAAGAAAPDAGWRAGAEVMAGDRLYLLHGNLLEERADPGRPAVLRQAMARQLIPAPAGGGYAWLRQAAPVSSAAGNAAVKAAREALTREHDLLGRVKGIAGVPAVLQLAVEAGRTTLALSWPTTKHGEPCRTLGAAFPPGVPRDRWHLHLLLTGFRGLAATLSQLDARGVTHRNLTPDGIIVTGNGRFMLRDLGLAARPPRPGEGPPGYQAPEQGLAAGRARPGPATDVCQLGAITYHLVTGHLPAPRNPVPARALNPGLPEAVSDVIAAALASGPGSRPRLREFRAGLAMSQTDSTPDR